jgi:hypothetical protein
MSSYLRAKRVCFTRSVKRAANCTGLITSALSGKYFTGMPKANHWKLQLFWAPKRPLTIEVNDDVGLHAGQGHKLVEGVLHFSFVCGGLKSQGKVRWWKGGE